MTEETPADITENPEERSASENLEASKTHARQAAEELRTAASQKAREFTEVALDHGSRLKSSAAHATDNLRDYAGERWDDAKSQLADFKSESERYVRENPGKSVLIALGVGFIIGRILR